MNRADVVKAIVWLDQLGLQVKSERAKLAAELAADAKAEYEEQSVAPTWRIPDVATVSASVSHTAPFVSHEPSFTEWVAKRYPSEVYQAVRPASVTRILSLLEITDGVAHTLDGEVVPGVSVRQGGEFAGVSIRATGAAKEVFGALAGHGLRELAAKASPAVPVVLAELEGVSAD